MAPPDDGHDAASVDDVDGSDDAATRRDSETGGVIVPLRVYKAVTVFSTLIAVVCVVGGFALLDVATEQGTATSLADVDPVLGLVGLGLIAAGGLVYAYASRFRAEGMGKDKDKDRRD